LKLHVDGIRDDGDENCPKNGFEKRREDSIKEIEKEGCEKEDQN
jgi:hypothetical protein